MSNCVMPSSANTKLKPPAGPTGQANQAKIQKILDENYQLIQAIVEYQHKGKMFDCIQYQQCLHRNLIYLATIADSSQNVQALMGLPAPMQPMAGQQAGDGLPPPSQSAPTSGPVSSNMPGMMGSENPPSFTGSGGMPSSYTSQQQAAHEMPMGMPSGQPMMDRRQMMPPGYRGSNMPQGGPVAPQPGYQSQQQLPYPAYSSQPNYPNQNAGPTGPTRIPNQPMNYQQQTSGYGVPYNSVPQQQMSQGYGAPGYQPAQISQPGQMSAVSGEQNQVDVSQSRPPQPGKQHPMLDNLASQEGPQVNPSAGSNQLQEDTREADKVQAHEQQADSTDEKSLPIAQEDALTSPKGENAQPNQKDQEPLHDKPPVNQANLEAVGRSESPKDAVGEEPNLPPSNTAGMSFKKPSKPVASSAQQQGPLPSMSPGMQQASMANMPPMSGMQQQAHMTNMPPASGMQHYRGSMSGIPPGAGMQQSSMSGMFPMSGMQQQGPMSNMPPASGYQQSGPMSNILSGHQQSQMSNVLPTAGMHQQGPVSGMPPVSGMHQQGPMSNVPPVSGMHQQSLMSNMPPVSGMHQQGPMSNMTHVSGMHQQSPMSNMPPVSGMHQQNPMSNMPPASSMQHPSSISSMIQNELEGNSSYSSLPGQMQMASSVGSMKPPDSYAPMSSVSSQMADPSSVGHMNQPSSQMPPQIPAQRMNPMGQSSFMPHQMNQYYGGPQMGGQLPSGQDQGHMGMQGGLAPGQMYGSMSRRPPPQMVPSSYPMQPNMYGMPPSQRGYGAYDQNKY